MQIKCVDLLIHMKRSLQPSRTFAWLINERGGLPGGAQRSLRSIATLVGNCCIRTCATMWLAKLVEALGVSTECQQAPLRVILPGQHCYSKSGFVNVIVLFILVHGRLLNYLRARNARHVPPQDSAGFQLRAKVGILQDFFIGYLLQHHMSG